MKILFVDGNTVIAKRNTDFLRLCGHVILRATTAKKALLVADEADCAVLETALPDSDGFSLAVKLREVKPLPVIFLTYRDSDEILEKCFGTGDDYLRKPNNPKELALRIESALASTMGGHSGILSLPPLVIDTKRLIVRIGDRRPSLTPREYAILMVLCHFPNQLLTYDRIFKELWGEGEVSAHLVRQNVSTLRRKLEETAPACNFIKTVHGMGYMLKYPPEVVDQ